MSHRATGGAPDDLYDQAASVAARLQDRLGLDRVEAVCVLGSGLGDAVASLDDGRSMPASEIPELPRSAVEGHRGVIHAGKIGALGILMFQGRVHTYEGVPAWQTTLAVRAAALLGARAAVLTNSAGAANPTFSAGDLMLIRDHLNLSGRNPLLGPNDPRLGPRFPDLSFAYDREFGERALSAARSAGLLLREGVYAWMLGPSYETPAEVKMARLLGADAVGMSTVPETIVARQMGLRVLALSCITNLGAGLSPTPLCHDEVKEVAGPAARRLARLLVEVLSHGLD